MCTVTLIARRNGYALGMNRDEKLARVRGLPPALHRLAGRDALFPSEPSGGTWIGVNDAGLTLPLINWYSVGVRAARQNVSRGEVVKAALPFDSLSTVDEALAALPLARVNPFRLIGVFPAHKAVAEWRWNLTRLNRLDHRWRTNTWISSSFDESGAQQARGKTFGKMLRQRSAESVDWLRRLHQAHAPEIGPYSICMHRNDAATVSCTEIVVSGSVATVRYQPGPPCCRMPMSTRTLKKLAPSGPSLDKRCFLGSRPATGLVGAFGPRPSRPSPRLALAVAPTAR